MDSLLRRVPHLVIITAGVLAANAAAYAQNANANANAKTNAAAPAAKANAADDDWAAITSLMVRSGTAQSHVAKNQSQNTAKHLQDAAKMRDTAKAAKAFYTKHPDDPRASQARKIDAISGLHGVEDGNADQELAAVSTAASFRRDTKMAAKDRFDVAMAMDHRDLSKRVSAKAVTNRDAEEKKLVESWRTEFNDIPEVEVYAVGAARHATPAIASAMAGQISRSASAPAEVKAEAKSLSARAQMLGSSPQLKVIDADGAEVDLSNLIGKTTLVVAWPVSQSNVLQELARFSLGIRKDTQIIYIAVGGTQADAAKIRSTLPIPGQSTFATAEAAVGALHLYTMPYVFTVNRAGKLTDFGPLSQAATVLRRAGAIVVKRS